MRAGKLPNEGGGRQKLVQLVYTAILNEVTEGRLPPNSRLIQDELAEAYGVSRQPVQQALLLLRDHGIVHDAPRRGFVVAPLNIERVRNMYQVRAALEGLASGLAAQYGQSQARREGPAVIESGRAAFQSGSVRRMIDADTLFHAFVSDISGNPIITGMMVPHYTNMERVMAEVLQEDTSMPEMIWRQHNAIMEAIQSGDATTAERLGRGHIEDAATRILTRFRARDIQTDAVAVTRRVRPH